MQIQIVLLKIGTKRTINHLQHIKLVEMLNYGGKYINAEKIKSEVFRGFLYKNLDTSRETEYKILRLKALKIRSSMGDIITPNCNSLYAPSDPAQSEVVREFLIILVNLSSLQIRNRC